MEGDQRGGYAMPGDVGNQNTDTLFVEHQKIVKSLRRRRSWADSARRFPGRQVAALRAAKMED